MRAYNKQFCHLYAPREQKRKLSLLVGCHELIKTLQPSSRVRMASLLELPGSHSVGHTVSAQSVFLDIHGPFAIGAPRFTSGLY